MASPEPPALELRSLTAGYGARKVLTGLDLHVQPGELVAVVGHNGAGKTTALRVAAGLKTPSEGSTFQSGRDLRGMSASARARGGLGLVPEGVAGLFPTLTVRENLDAVQVYAEAKDPDGWAHVEAEMRALFATVLEDRSGQVAGSMSGGQRQMLAIALALTRRPSVLLLDEPSTGLGPAIVGTIFKVLETLVASTSTAVVLVEQNLADALKVAHRVVVVQSGRAVATFPRDNFPPATELWKYF